MIIWLTGLPCSGKTTIGRALLIRLRQSRNAEFLDGDEVRARLWPELGFTREHRIENVRRLGRMAEYLARKNFDVIVAAVSPYRSIRNEVRARFYLSDACRDSDQFIEVFVNAPLEVCIQRDVKGMYAKALAGEIANFTGVDDLYEVPIKPEVRCNTASETIAESVWKILAFVDQQKARRLDMETKLC